MKVAAVYHDIGKMVNPKIFTENQLDDESPHDKLDPWVSFQLISRHVGDTVNILLNNGFPRNIIEIVSQHHGNGVVSYFFNKSKSKNEDEYRYHCSKPNCVESAVLCICDHVEATSRSRYQSNKFDPVRVIEDTINNLINDGQLDDVLIRLGDLKKIKTTLAKELEGTYQKRVDYDESKKKELSEDNGDTDGDN
jgi:putative nucleotidyltransferase with HDIG domain